MSALTLAVFLLGQAAPATAPGTEVRALTVTLLDEKDQEVTDVSADDVALTENGVARDITSFKPDRRPLTVAVLVDNNHPAYFGGGINQNFIEAFAALPQLGVREAYALARNSFEASFVGAPEKAAFIARLDACCAGFV